jgi:hypothetical protein
MHRLSRVQHSGYLLRVPFSRQLVAGRSLLHAPRAPRLTRCVPSADTCTCPATRAPHHLNIGRELRLLPFVVAFPHCCFAHHNLPRFCMQSILDFLENSGIFSHYLLRRARFEPSSTRVMAEVAIFEVYFSGFLCAFAVPRSPSILAKFSLVQTLFIFPSSFCTV